MYLHLQIFHKPRTNIQDDYASSRNYAPTKAIIIVSVLSEKSQLYNLSETGVHYHSRTWVLDFLKLTEVDEHTSDGV